MELEQSKVSKKEFWENKKKLEGDNMDSKNGNLIKAMEKNL